MQFPEAKHVITDVTYMMLLGPALELLSDTDTVVIVGYVPDVL
jgi:hypothetical protein